MAPLYKLRLKKPKSQVQFPAECCWSKTFLCFLASANEMSVSPGRRFMIDLLVSSLMADGGLESALNAAITAEIQVSMFYLIVISSFIHPPCLISATSHRTLTKKKTEEETDP